MIALFITVFIQTWLGNTFNQLMQATIDLPKRLQKQEKIHWPSSWVKEIESITVSIRHMADMVREIFRESETRYRALFKASTDALFVVDSDSNQIIDANAQAEELSGLTHDELLGAEILQFFSDQEQVQKCCQYVRQGVVIEPKQAYFSSSDDKPVPVSVSLLLFKLHARDVILVMLKDISEEYRINEHLQLTAKVFESTSEAILITDPQTRIIKVNRAFCKITGYQEAEILGKTPQVLHSSWQEKRFYDDMWQKISEAGEWQGELWNRRKDGTPYAEWLSIYQIQNSAGEVTNYVGIFIDITEQIKTQERIHKLAFYDALTGLPNRSLFMDRLTHAMDKADRNDSKVALLFLDLDNFKTINDTLGHQTGDLLLQALTRKLKSMLSHSDTFARLGGDEFTLIIEDVEDIRDVMMLARRLLDVFEHPFSLPDDKELFTSASIGICVYPDDGESLHDLMRNADTAMYRAKALGKNTFQFYISEMNEAAQQRLRLEEGLRRVGRDGGLMVHFQPQINISSNTLIGVEALVRWIHPDYGLISPDIFIPIAEDTGLIVPISEWIFEHCCRQLREWLDEGYRPLRMAVNLSGIQLRQRGFAKIIDGIMKEFNIPPQLIELELTERVLMDTSEVTQTLDELKALGVSLAIDDFGTGY